MTGPFTVRNILYIYIWIIQYNAKYMDRQISFSQRNGTNDFFFCFCLKNRSVTVPPMFGVCHSGWKSTNDFRPIFVAIELESQIITLYPTYVRTYINIIYISQMSDARCHCESYSSNNWNKIYIVCLLLIIRTYVTLKMNVTMGKNLKHKKLRYP